MTMTAQELRRRARETLGGGIFQTTWLMVLLFELAISLASSILSATGIGAIALFVISGSIAFTTSRVMLTVLRTKEFKWESVKDNFIDSFKTDFLGNFLLYLLQSIFIFLWSLLFVIPGIIKTFSYSMSFYIKADHPEYDWNKCITESRKMMDGHKFRLFCLYLSFIGWILVAIITCGIGMFWISPYINTAKAHFYEDLRTRTEVAEEPVAPQGEEPQNDAN